MKRAKRWLLITATVLLLGLLGSADAALPFKKVSVAKTPAYTTTTTTSTTTTTTTPQPDDEEVPQSTGETEESKTPDNTTLTKNSKLTGIPQIDYIWDPNLPRELHGYNLSTYPFLSTVPPNDEIHFKCEGLHDGFYASIEYKCQIYHHCVYGIRHDFLCANFTAFDQKTFICHFASDVDCEGSQKYWNRNDALYMATTTSSTSTTTTEAPPAPPAPPRRRQQRPYHRPYNRRPVDDYYYDDDLEDEYYEERLPRRKPRPRPRKPQLDYDDEYDDKEKPVPRRNPNRYRDEDELIDDDYDDRRNRPGARRGKPTAAAAGGRGKGAPRKPGRVEERRSFNEERGADEPRRAAGRRRSNEKRTTPSTAAVLDELDEYEKPYSLDQEEAAEEQTPQKVKTTPKPLAEFVTPKAAAASVYARPRAPPRIARPVPINEKKKFSYPVQKNPVVEQEDDDYYQDRNQHEDDYEQPTQPARTAARRRTAAAAKEQKPTRSTLRKPVTDKKILLEDQDYYEETPRNRKRPLASRARTPAPAAADLDFVDDVDYEEEPKVPVKTQRFRNKAAPAPAPAATAGRKAAPPRPRQPIVQETEEEEELEEEPVSEEPVEQPRAQPARTKTTSLLGVSPARRNQKLAIANRQRAALAASKTTSTTTTQAPEEPAEPAEEEPIDVDEPLAPAAPVKPQRTASVRVVKRPFLPSRGGSPYLPRGLQPVGVAVRPQLSSEATRTTDSTPIDMGSTISGVRLLEHGAPLLRGSNSDESNDDDNDDGDGDGYEQPAPSPNPVRTTLPPRSPLPVTPRRPTEPPQPVKLNLDELYENDYDVTLNDALDPTLKPLTPLHHQQQQLQHHQQHQQQQQHSNYQSRPYASAYVAAAPANPFAGHNSNSYHQHYQNHSPSSSSSAIASASQSQQSPVNYHSDSYFSSTDLRRRAIVPAQNARSHRHEYTAGGGVSVGSNQQTGSRLAQHFYDDLAY